MYLAINKLSTKKLDHYNCQDMRLNLRLLNHYIQRFSERKRIFQQSKEQLKLIDRLIISFLYDNEDISFILNIY